MCKAVDKGDHEGEFEGNRVIEDYVERGFAVALGNCDRLSAAVGESDVHLVGVVY